MSNNSSNKSNSTTLSTNDTNDEKINTQIYEESLKIYNSIINSDINLKDYDDLIEIYKNKNKDNNNNNIEQNIYYLINKEWLIRFKNFCNSKDPFTSFIFPGEINNKKLIINDSNALKEKNDTRIFFNNKLDFDKSCMFIEKEFWRKLITIFKGGPSYKIIHYENDFFNLIKEGCHINLLLIPSEIISLNKINFIHINYLYFDINKKIKDLKIYINKILNSNKDKFFIKNKEILEENKHYRLWIYSTFIGKRESIAIYISKNIKNMIYSYQYNKDDSNNLIDWKNFSKINGNYDFLMYLLSNFKNNEIKDIFPNRYTQNFDYKEQYGNLKREDEYRLPEFTIEMSPYKFINEEKKYKIGECSKCHYSEYVYYACECEKLFFCSYNCEKRYKKKDNSHFLECKIYLKKLFKNENEDYYKNKILKLTYPLTGLLNLGNTCYMNSALQCMRSIKQLTKYFLKYFNESQININNKIGTEGFLTMAYANFIYKMNKCDKEFFNPCYFKNSIGIIDKRYDNYEQQDIHEFLIFLIDSMHEDLNKVINKPIIQRKESDINNKLDIGSNKLLDDKKSIIEWNDFLKRNQSIMVDLFYGQYKTTISCPCCNHNSIIFSIYLSLQLPLPEYQEYFMIKVFLREEGPSTNFIKINIILNKKNNKVIDVKNILGIILRIPSYQLEILKTEKMEIIKVLEDDEEINENINFINVVKINLILINNNNIYNKNKINYSELNENSNKNINYYINIFKKYNNNNNIINEKNKNDNTIIYDNYCLEKFIIKHYYFKEKNIFENIFNRDYLIYLNIDQTCYDLYYKIFEIYYLILITNFFSLKENNNIQKWNKEENKNFLFNKFFKDFIDKVDKYSDNIFNINNNIPFILKLKNNKNGEYTFIPPLKSIIFKDFFKNNKKKDNNNDNNKDINKNENNNSNNEGKLEKEEFNDLDNIGFSELNDNNIENNDDQVSIVDKIPSGNFQKDKKIQNNQNNQNEKIENNINNININNNNELSFSNQKKEKDNSLLIDISKEKNTKYTERKLDEKEFNIKTIAIIWNPKFLYKKESDDSDNYMLINSSLINVINLLPFFQKIYDDNFKKISIYKCFQEFSKEETFDNDNLWKCSECNQNIPAKNKIEIYQTPKILIIQLKRFKNNQKIKTFVDFPLTNLDISKFVEHSKSKYKGMTKKYDLFAVANHYGGLEYGHYDAYCLNYIDNCWYNFNDRSVQKINKEDENKIVTNDAYILFYKEKNIDKIDWDKIYEKKFVEINDNNMKSYEEDFIYKKNSNEEEIIELVEDSESINNDKKIKNNNIENKNKYKDNESPNIDDISLDNLDEVSLGGFVYNPFRDSYLKLKRHSNKS